MLYADVPAQIIYVYDRKNQNTDVQDTIGSKGAVTIRQYKNRQKQHQRQQGQDHTANMSRKGDQNAAYKRMNQHGECENPDDSNQFCGFILLSGVPADIFIDGGEDRIFFHP